MACERAGVPESAGHSTMRHPQRSPPTVGERGPTPPQAGVVSRMRRRPVAIAEMDLTRAELPDGHDCTDVRGWSPQSAASGRAAWQRQSSELVDGRPTASRRGVGDCRFAGEPRHGPTCRRGPAPSWHLSTSSRLPHGPAGRRRRFGPTSRRGEVRSSSGPRQGSLTDSLRGVGRGRGRGGHPTAGPSAGVPGRQRHASSRRSTRSVVRHCLPSARWCPPPSATCWSAPRADRRPGSAPAPSQWRNEPSIERARLVAGLVVDDDQFEVHRGARGGGRRGPRPAGAGRRGRHHHCDVVATGCRPPRPERGSS